jgi:hypothetical protein
VAETGARALPAVADLGALGASVAAIGSSHGQYLKLTPRAMRLLQEHGQVPSGDGTFWGFVRGRTGFAGNLDFEAVDFSPEQMLSLQTAAVGLALRAAIKEVQAAVERVENKVEEISDLLASERIGDVLGTRRALEPLVERARRDGRISATDWSGIAPLGASIAKDVETLRAFLRKRLIAAKGGLRPSERVRDAEALVAVGGLVAESIALLVIAEHNLAAWQELRILNVAANEPGHVDWTIADAAEVLRSSQRDDQAIIDELRAVAERLTTPSALDGLAPWQRRDLQQARSDLDELSSWFASQRLLDQEPMTVLPYPTVGDSLRHVRSTVVGAVSRSVDRAGRKLRKATDDPLPLELPPADPSTTRPDGELEP